MSSLLRSAFIPGLLIGLLLGLVLAGFDAPPFDDRERSLSEEAIEVIEQSYFHNPDSGKLDDASVEGMVGQLRKRYDDRFSHYFDPKMLERFEAATEGRFSGVGMAVNEVKRGLRVARVYPDTPAAGAGIEEGDVIVAVDGDDLSGVPARLAAAKIKGKPGTEVSLRVQQADGETREMDIERAEVRIPAAQGELRQFDGEKIAYVQLMTFSEGAHGELRDEVEKLYRRGAQGLVLDVRGNGGGLLNEGILTSSVFVEKGLIVATEGRTQPRREYEAVGDALEPRPTAVLINEDTASAAEIFAAALADHGVAELVGARTFGKGTFQEVIGLEHGGALDLTVGEYVTSEGESLAGAGIKPDVRVKDDPKSKSDEALRRALREVAAGL